MIEKFGLDADSDRETYPNISYLEYMDTYEIDEDSADDKVAVVTVEGTITRGEIQPGYCWSRWSCKTIEKCS